MKSMSGKELAKLLEANGWNLLRIQGSHHIYGKPTVNTRISIPIHRNQDLKIGLLRNLLKQAELLEIFQPNSKEKDVESSERSLDNLEHEEESADEV
jgi:predicted RNA binding protein YcfA (HicA-like mRNA interferase family)